MKNFKSIWNDWFHHATDAILILLIALFLRVYNIFSIPIFADEAIYIRWSQVMKSVSTLRFLPLSDGKQPLFMWITIPFLKIFEDPLVAARMVSVACGMASCIGIAVLSYILFKSRKAALLSSFFYAVSPFSVFFDRMALADSMLMMFGIWAMVLGTLTAKFKRLDLAMLTGFALGGAWLTKSPAIFFFALLPLTVIVTEWKGFKGLILQGLKCLPFFIVSWILGFGFYNILRLGPEFHMIAIRNKDYIFSFQEVLKHPLDPFKPHLFDISNWYGALLPGSILLVALLGLLFGFRRYWKEFILLSAWTVIPLLVQAEVAKVFTARYILFTIPPIFIIASLCLTQIFKLKQSHYWAIVGLVTVPALILNFNLLTNPEKASLPKNERSGYLELWTAGTGIREVAQYIKQERQNNPSQTIVVGTEGYFGTLPDGLQIYIADLPNTVVKGIGIWIEEVDQSLIDAKKSGNKVYLVANSSRIHATPEKMGLRTIAEYAKAEQPTGTREKLMFFEVTDESVKIREEKNAQNSKLN